MAEVPQDLLDRLRALEEKVRLMDGRAQIRPAMDVVTDGEVHIGTNGRLVLDDVDGSQLLFAGGITPNYQDGSPQRGIILWRSSGEIAAALYADGADVTKSQKIALWDKTGAMVLATAVDGLARPYVPIPMYPAPVNLWPSTTSTTFTDMWEGELPRQHAKARVAVLGWCNTAAATGELRLLVNGTPTGGTQAINNASVGFGIWTVNLPGAHMATVNLKVQARMVSGTGSALCRGYSAWGQE